MPRKVPYSGKKKKNQILQKRKMKGPHKFLKPNDSYDDGETTEDAEFTAKKLMEQPQNRAGASCSVRNRNQNRYNLQFYQESKRELEHLRLESHKPLDVVTPKQREIDGSYFDGFDFPIRPEWSYGMNKETLDRNENRYFREYVDQLQKLQKNRNVEKGNAIAPSCSTLSLFELNLETWRQLWRVLEFSDILLIIVDVRYSTLMFPPSLYKYIKDTIKKHAILVLNKVDLVAPEVVIAWRQYFRDLYPGMPIVLFASYATKVGKGDGNRSSRHKRSMEGVYDIFRECKKMTPPNEVDLSSWEQKIREDMEIDCIFDNDTEIAECSTIDETNAIHPCENKKQKSYEDGILTIGCIGFPNVGKSTLINALKGRKVVSVSRTPGHTKHFQTIFLTREVRLCDCPGLVFPSSTPKHIQVLLGAYPISQLQVPYRALKFMTEHLNLPQLLKLHLPEDYEEWSSAAVADAWALKRGFLTAKAARPDRYRAANNLLRMCLAGQQQLVLQFFPPGFHEQRDEWLKNPELEQIKKYKNKEEKKKNADESSVNSESYDSDEESISSNDETNVDEADEELGHESQQKSRNAFALLEDE